MVAVNLPVLPRLPFKVWVGELWWLLRFADALLIRLLGKLLLLLRRVPLSARLPLFSVAVAAFFGAKGVLGYLADPRPVVAVLAVPLIAALGLVLFCAWACSGLASRGRSIRHVHSAGPRYAAIHEAGHAAVGRYIGAVVAWAWINRSGEGCTLVRDQRKPVVQQLAVTLAGGMAQGVSEHSHYCSGDKNLVGWHLAGVPKGQHGRYMSEARRIARAGLAAEAAYRRRVEKKLLGQGHL